jgi:hypothetical protein
MSDPQETAAMHPAAAGEAPAATESEAPITTQVLAADDVCQPLAFAVFACTGKGVWLTAHSSMKMILPLERYFF